MDITQEIMDILRSLGITKTGKGRTRTAAAIALAFEDEDRMTVIGRDIYQVVGRSHHCEGSAVERNIRTVVRKAWSQRRARLEELAGYDLDGPPTAKEFVEIISTHLQRKLAAQGQG